MEFPFFLTIVDMDVKASRHGDQELGQFLMGVTAPFGSAGDVVEVIDSLDLERDMPPALDEG